MQWLADNLNIEIFRLGETAVSPLTFAVLLLTISAALLLGRGARLLAVRVLAKKGGASEGAAYAVGRIGQYAIVIAGFVMALDNVGIDVTALAALGAVVSVGIGFGLQNIAQNFISGLILLVERPVQKGEFVKIGDTEGIVEEIEMRATRLMTRDGISVLVPNSRLITEDVENLSAPNSDNRLRIEVGTAYGSDTRLVRKVLMEIAERDGRVLETPKPVVFFRSFGDSALDFELAVWINDPRARPGIASDLRFAIDDGFRKHGIQIPFPQRDLHIVSGAPPLDAAG